MKKQATMNITPEALTDIMRFRPGIKITDIVKAYGLFGKVFTLTLEGDSLPDNCYESGQVVCGSWHTGVIEFDGEGVIIRSEDVDMSEGYIIVPQKYMRIYMVKK